MPRSLFVFFIHAVMKLLVLNYINLFLHQVLKVLQFTCCSIFTEATPWNCFGSNWHSSLGISDPSSMYLILMDLDFAGKRCPFFDNKGSEAWVLCQIKLLELPSHFWQHIYVLENNATLPSFIFDFSCFLIKNKTLLF